jgi:hypothetical protein
MKTFADYMILPELGLILECCTGQATVDDAIRMKQEELSDELYQANYHIIVDFRAFETFFDTTLTDSISKFFMFLKSIEIKGKVAFLTTSPQQVVISELLKSLGKDSVEIDIFSTAEAAIKFLGFSDDDFEVIHAKIQELNHQTP